MNRESILVLGKRRLEGRVMVQGSKNDALPKLASLILFNDEVVLDNVPDLDDIHAMLAIIEYLGATYTYENSRLTVDCSGITYKPIPLELSGKLRASSVIMGPMIARFGKAEVGMPGGCNIGARKLDYHFSGFEAFGVNVHISEDLVHLEREPSQIQGVYEMPSQSVGATQNLVMASVYTKGKTIIKNIAVEPEVKGLIQFLNHAGANIRFVEPTTVEITGGSVLKRQNYHVKPDRIEAGTLMIAALITKGSVELVGVNHEELGYVIHKLREMGAKVEVAEDRITVAYVGALKETHIKTGVYPGFPTDLQPQMTILMTQAEGVSSIEETIFENRFGHLEELIEMGVDIEMESTKKAWIKTSKLNAKIVEGRDLRGAASMILAGLCADGSTIVKGLEHLDRGYDRLVEKFKHLKADIHYL